VRRAHSSEAITGCLSTAERLLGAVAELSVPIDEKTMQATISLGGAVWMLEEESVEALIRRADIALYQAKERGRNNHVVV
jgi:diguanylate cyclase (GGDEF)-like protein